MRDDGWAQRTFWALFVVVLVVKVAIAARLPLFVDEAFYWLEGQRLAPAYSDLPGLTAWLIRLGVEVGGDHPLAVRAPFLLIAALVPLLVVRIGRREFPGAAGWQAGSLALLLPLVGSLGLLAVPDVPMALATLLCVDAGARMLRRIDAAVALQLGLGLAIGALSHYRFIGVIGVGFVALLMLPAGRRALRDVRILISLAFGAVAWAPLLIWNLDNADAGLRFQLIDRHPWAFHLEGLWFIAVQALLVTPLLLAALAVAAWRGARSRARVPRYLGGLGAMVVLGFFVLGFFSDTERVSFHWPLPGYLALLPLVPVVLAAWPAWARWLTWSVAGLGLAATLAYYVGVSVPELRARSAAQKWYPSNFAGWSPLARAVGVELAQMPRGTAVVADHFKLGAELGFERGDDSIQVLDHPLNHRHGRAPQLRLWGLETAGRVDWGDRPVLLVVGASEVAYKDLLRHFHGLCARVGPLPPPRVLNIDHGRQRFLLFRLQGPLPGASGGACTAPAMAWLDAPASGAEVSGQLQIEGWAFKDGVGLEKVELMLDGQVLGTLEYGLSSPGVADFWDISNDPNHPAVGLRGEVDLTGVAPGLHWLGLRMHGRDGSVEDWSEQPLNVVE
ncbi:MAG: glycosyltransferase family 39 protein [Pseudomonadota bacterium]|nr:glycosyltransferase family 39 protein [Pseudomonadota bacterium]